MFIFHVVTWITSSSCKRSCSCPTHANAVSHLFLNTLLNSVKNYDFKYFLLSLILWIFKILDLFPENNIIGSSIFFYFWTSWILLFLGLIYNNLISILPFNPQFSTDFTSFLIIIPIIILKRDNTKCGKKLIEKRTLCLLCDDREH